MGAGTKLVEEEDSSGQGAEGRPPTPEPCPQAGCEPGRGVPHLQASFLAVADLR